MHTIWKGVISFGLVNIPVKMYSSIEDKEIKFKTLHNHCLTPVSNVRHCNNCNVTLESSHIIKGYEYEKDQYVTFEDHELKTINEYSSKEIQILHFVESSEVDPIYYNKSYYLGPDLIGESSYNLFVCALSKTRKAAISNVTIRSKSSLGLIRVLGNCLVLETMVYPDEIRSVDKVPNLSNELQVNSKQLDLFETLINKLSSSFKPESYVDVQRMKVLEVIEKKIAGDELSFIKETITSNKIVDLLTALEASLELHEKKKVNDEKNNEKGKKRKRKTS